MHFLVRPLKFELKPALKRLFPVLSLIFLMACASPVRNPWRETVKAASGPPEAIGGYSAGCLKGALSLYPDGDGYRVMRPSRRRFYGHPNLIRFIEDLGLHVKKNKLGLILVGDLAQPRGGPTLSGHVSHQTGLDVDLWYWQPNKSKLNLTLDERENAVALDMLTPDGESLDPKRWSSRNLAILKVAAEHQEVERIFVNPIIKRELCHSSKGESWLQKIRPWWGHSDHFHVRLRCPKNLGSITRCTSQEAPSDEDGCGKALEDWFTDEMKLLAKEKKDTLKPSEMPQLPEACNSLITPDP